MTLDNDHNAVAPRYPSDAPPRSGAQAAAEGVAAPAATMAPASPSQDTDGHRDGTSAAEQPSTLRAAAWLPLAARAVVDALDNDLRAYALRALLVWGRSLYLLAGLVADRSVARERAVKMGDDATEYLTDAPHERGGAMPGAVDARDAYPAVCAIVAACYGDAPGELASYVANGNTSAAELAPFVDALAALARAPSVAPRLVRLSFDGADPTVAALLRDVGCQCERACNPELAIATLTAMRVARGESWRDEYEPDALADALASVASELTRDHRDAAKAHREAVAALVAARRNDSAEVIAAREREMLAARSDLARVGALVGRVADALAAAQ